MCIYGGKCFGCKQCEKEYGKIVDRCDHCGEPIFEGYDYYEIDCIVVHDDCLKDWAQEFKKRG